MDGMIATITVHVLMLSRETQEEVAVPMTIRIDRISATIPDRCTRNDKGGLLVDGSEVRVVKNFNNAFRAFCEHNRMRSIAPFN